MLRKDVAPIWIGLSMTVVAGMATLSAFLADVESQTANAGSVASYERVEGWPQPPPAQNGGPGFGNMTGVAVDGKGFVYAARRCPGKCGYLTEGAGDPMGSILVWDPSGTFVREWKDVVHETHGVYIDRHGFIWVTDIQKQQVKKFRPDGTVVLTLGKYGVRDGTTPDTFNQPTDVIVAGPNDDVFVSDGYGGLCPSKLPGCEKGAPVTTMRVVKFNKDGKFLKTWGRRGTGPGEFRVPHSITADSRGRIYVADRCGRTSEPPCTDGRLQIFDGEGTFLTQWTPPGAGGKFNPFGVRVDNDDRLYVLDGEARKVWILDTRNGNQVVGTVDGVGGPSGHHVAVNPRTGDVYTVELMLGIKHFARGSR